MPRCKLITAEHRKYWNCVQVQSGHAEMIADQMNSKTYTNCSNGAALAGHSNDVVFD
jgi:ribosomal protein S27AE